MAHRGAQLATQARQQLQARLNAVEGEGTSPLGRASGGPGTGAVTLSAAELRALVSDAVETALAARASADTHADAQREHDEGAPPALGAFMQEVRAFITTAQAVGTPGSNTIVLKKAKRYELGASTSREKVTQGVYTLLLKHGLHFKPSAEEMNDILTSATTDKASEADLELSKLNVVKDCENLRSNVKRGLRSVDGLPALWLAKGGLTVGGAGQQLPSFPGGADAALQVIVLRSLYLALPEHFRKCKNAMDAAASWRTRVGLCEPAYNSLVSAASTLWDARRDGKEAQENAQAAGADGALLPVATWVCLQAREGRANKKTKRQSSAVGTFGINITNTTLTLGN